MQEIHSLLEKRTNEEMPPSLKGMQILQPVFSSAKEGWWPASVAGPAHPEIHFEEVKFLNVDAETYYDPDLTRSTIDLKDAYFNFQIISKHRKFLSFAFGGKAFLVLHFGQALAPYLFTKCMVAALAPLKPPRYMCPKLPWWLANFSSIRDFMYQYQDLVLNHLQRLSLR